MDAMILLFLSLWEEVGGFAERLRFADLLDVAVMTVLLYGVMRWLREGATRSVLVLVCLIAGLVVVARLLDMYLTQLLLDTLLTVAVIVLVVAYQPEIRRLLERLAAGELFRRRAPEHDISPVIDAIVSAAWKMATERVGALIAVRGREPWSHFIEGGVRLGGRVSEAVLLSLFDPGSPGHDGAVLVEGDRIARFAAHLPLSKNLEAIGHRGTRHTAALGLTEQCDALVVVVSEERGEVSVAEGGTLTTLATATQLKARLGTFWEQRHALREPGRRRGSSREAVFIIASLVLAAVFWALFAYPGDVVYRTFSVPVEFRNTPSSLAMASNSATNVTVTIAGSPQAFRRLQPADLTAVINLSHADPGTNTLTAAQWQLDLPSGLSLYATNPADVTVELVQRKAPP